MGVIIPAILPASEEDLDDKLRRLEALDGLVDAVQIDVVDGKFASPPSWPYAPGGSLQDRIISGEMLPHASRMRYEIDLMVESPESVTGSWISLGARRLTIHAESTRYLPQIVTDFQTTYGHEKGFAPDLLSFGFALNLDTDSAIIEPFIDRIDYVQFMGIAAIGKQGQAFDERVIRKIEVFKKRHPDIPIQVDGGVSYATAPKLLAAGATSLIVGSDLWKAPDVHAEFVKLAALAENYGRYE